MTRKTKQDPFHREYLLEGKDSEEDALLESDEEEGDDEIVKKEAAEAEDVVDGEDAAAKDAAVIKASAKKKAAEPAVGSGAKADSMDTLNASDVLPEATFKADLDALVQSEATLSDGFKQKAEVIFEAAFTSKLSAKITALQEQYEEQLVSESARIESEMADKIDSYLNYVVENWIEENKLSIDNGLRTEIAESFMTALQGVFTEHYVEVPESKIDLVDALSTKLESVEQSLNAAEAKNIVYSEQVKQLTKDSILDELSDGLSQIQAEKLREMTADIDFEDTSKFESKVKILKESYFTKDGGARQIDSSKMDDIDSIHEEGSDKVVSPAMAAYVQALSKTNK